MTGMPSSSFKVAEAWNVPPLRIPCRPSPRSWSEMPGGGRRSNRAMHLSTERMTTTLSFRVDDQLFRELEAEAKTSGLTKTQLLHEAIPDLLYRRACERDAELYAALPLRREETKLWATETWPKDEPGTDWEAVFES